MLVTNDQVLFERCVAYGHYDRTGSAAMYNIPDIELADPALLEFAGAPLVGPSIA